MSDAVPGVGFSGERIEVERRRAFALAACHLVDLAQQRELCVDSRTLLTDERVECVACHDCRLGGAVAIVCHPSRRISMTRRASASGRASFRIAESITRAETNPYSA